MFKSELLKRYTILLRVENVKTRNGAYRCNLADVMLPRGSSLRDRHPSPDMDKGICEYWNKANYNKTSEFLFGFKDIEQYKHWFHDEEHIKDGIKNDGVMACYIVPEKQQLTGVRQRIARKERMMHIIDISLDTALTTQEIVDKLEQLVIEKNILGDK